MTRKNKIICAIAAGAIALTVGSGAARCAMSDAGQPSADESTAATSSADPQVDGESAEGASESEGGFADLKNTSWTSEDGKSTLSIIEGALIERTGDKSTILYYTVQNESNRDGTLSAMLATSKKLTDPEKLTVCMVSGTSGGGMRLTCDELSAAYIKDGPTETEMELVGIDENLTSLFGKDAGEFASVVSGYAAQKSPYATRATWDKEVWIDFGAGTYLTNFVLNDAASTIVTVRMDGTGKLAVQ